MNETFKDTLCHIACLHSGDKWREKKRKTAGAREYGLYPSNELVSHP